STDRRSDAKMAFPRIHYLNARLSDAKPIGAGQTFLGMMSALGQKQTYAVHKLMSALHRKATSNATYGNVRFGPIVDIRSIIRSPRRRERATKQVSKFQSLEQSSNL